MAKTVDEHPEDNEELDDEEYEDDNEDDADTAEVPDELTITEENTRIFEKAEGQIKGFYEEIGSIAKKKPDGPVNTFKVKFINQALDRANKLLVDEFRPFEEFEQFDVDSLPTASDVVMMLAQYLKSMESFREAHSDSMGDWRVDWGTESEDE